MPQLALARVTENRSLGSGYFWLEMNAPALSREAEPGQFIHLHCRPADQMGTTDPLLRRPFSLAAINPADNAVAVLYRVVGRGTGLLQTVRPGTMLDVLGPLGSSFPVEFPERPGEGRASVVLVGGGYGAAPLLPLARRLAWKQVSTRVLLGARSAGDLVLAERFAELPVKLSVATEDGSRGRRGLVTDPLEELLQGEGVMRVYACGPRPMLAVVAAAAARQHTAAFVSLEEQMACGVGACLGCVQRIERVPAFGTADDRPVRVWARVCREGPVFAAERVLFDEGGARK